MGTRSLTFVYDEQGNKIINLYRQFDGYPTGHGQELAEFLNNQKMYNGAGDLAALLVAHFKKEPIMKHPSFDKLNNFTKLDVGGNIVESTIRKVLRELVK